MNDDPMIPISMEDRFGFGCSPRVRCFNECCRDLNQFLTPYDVLRIKQALGITSSDFLEQYCGQHMGPESGLPVVTLKPRDSVKKVCPFVTPEGCGIYMDRPSSCRMYPLMRAVSKSRETGRITEYFALLKEPHCLGHVSAGRKTVAEWIQDQGLEPYNEMNDKLLDIISLKNRVGAGPADLKTTRFFTLAMYDLDSFRRHVFEKDILSGMVFQDDIFEKAKTDDIALLTLGMEAVRQMLLSHKADPKHEGG